MKEKIIALLTAKFSGVRKDGLARLAGALSLQVANEEEAGVLVEKLTPEKVNEFITDYRKDVDKEVSDSNRTYETNLKKKHQFVEIKTDDDDPAKKSKGANDDETPAWAKAMMEQNKLLTEKIARIEGDKTNSTRLQTIEGRLKNVPEAFKAKALKDFKRMNFESDESFNEYLTELDTDVTTLTQELADKGLASHSKPAFGNPNKSDEDNFIQTMKDINQVEEKK